MRLDVDLARKILLAIEAEQNIKDYRVLEIAIEGCPAEVVDHYIRLLNDYGLIKAQEARRIGTFEPTMKAIRPTWKGYEFLDTFRQETLWNRAKEALREKGLDYSFAALLAAAPAVIGKVIGG